MRWTGLLLILAAVVGLLAPAVFNVQAVATPAFNLPTGVTTAQSFVGIIRGLTNWIFVLVLVISAIFLVLAGLQFIVSEGNPAMIAQARSKLIYAVVGLIVAATAGGIPLAIQNLFGVMPSAAAHWGFSDGSGVVLADATGSNDGTIVGAIWVAGRSGIPGTALDFSGAADYVEIPDASAINFSGKDSITVAAWIKLNSIPTGQVAILHKWSGYVLETTPAAPTNRIRWTLETTSYLTLPSTTLLTPGQWYHIAGTYDGSQAILYVNGSPENQQALSGAIADAGVALRFGCRSDGPPCLESFDGQIEDVRIYDRALAPEQIQTLYEE